MTRADRAIAATVLATVLAASSTAAQPTSRVLPDGVVLWQRTASGTDKPWFFRQMETAFNLLMPSADRLPFGRSVALVIGISEYETITPDLEFVKNDVEDVTRYLLDKGGFDAVYVMDSRVAKPELVEYYMTDKFRLELSPRDRLLFFYAGHGADLSGVTGYMQFASARRNSFSSGVISINRVIEWSSIIPAAHVMFVIDACSSGLAFAPVDRGDEDEVALMTSTLSGSGSRVVITAGTEREKTFEVKNGARGNGVFSRALLNALEADSPILTATEVFAKIEREVASFAAVHKKKVTPRLWRLQTSDYPGTFVFVNPSSRRRVDPAYVRAMNARARGSSDPVTQAGAAAIPEGWTLVARNDFDAVESPSWWIGTSNSDFVERTYRLSDGRFRWQLRSIGAPRTTYLNSPYPAIGDFHASVSIRIDTLGQCCASAGIQFRASENAEAYELRLGSRGYYKLGYYASERHTLVDWTQVTLEPNRPNQLAVTAIADTIRYYVNGRLMGFVTSARRLHGRIGLIAEVDSLASAVIDFDDFRIYAPRESNVPEAGEGAGTEAARRIETAPVTRLRSLPLISLTQEKIDSTIARYDFVHVPQRAIPAPGTQVLGRGLPSIFELEHDSVVYDQATQLHWQRGFSRAVSSAAEAGGLIEKMNREEFAGSRSWRLPTVEEAMSLLVRTERSFVSLGWNLTHPLFARFPACIVTSDLGPERGGRWTVLLDVAKPAPLGVRPPCTVRAVYGPSAWRELP